MSQDHLSLAGTGFTVHDFTFSESSASTVAELASFALTGSGLPLLAFGARW
jgi:hypothetical protein